MLTGEDKQWIIEAIEVSTKRIAAHIERVEKTLLSEFGKCASPADVHQRTRESIIEMRLTAVEQRVQYLELQMRKPAGL